VVSKYDKGAEHDTVELLSFRLEMLADWVSGVGLRAPQPEITSPKQHDPIANLLLAYPATSMVAVTRHWAQHLLDCTTRMLLPLMERFVEESLDNQFSNLDSPTMAIAVIIKLVNNVLRFLFEKNAATADLRAPAARGTLRTYTVMKPIAQEAIRCITALAAPWQMDTAGINDAAGRLENGLALLVGKAKISELRITPVMSNIPAHPSPLFRVLPGVSSDHDYFLSRSFDIFTHPAGAAMTEQCREQEVISWRNSFRNEYPLALQRCVPFITEHPLIPSRLISATRTTTSTMVRYSCPG
jgi:hypothetical protein